MINADVASISCTAFAHHGGLDGLHLALGNDDIAFLVGASGIADRNTDEENSEGIAIRRIILRFRERCRPETETGSGKQGRTADYLNRPDFIILDELGYLPFAQAGYQLLFHLISRL